MTLAKGRPFGFLDHNLRCGDSLLGIYRLDQLTRLSMHPTGQGQLRLFGQNIEQAVQEAIVLRQRLREIPIRDIHDVEAMTHLNAEARKKVEIAELLADAFVGVEFATVGSVLEGRLTALASQADQVVKGDACSSKALATRARADLMMDAPGDLPRRPFHWPLEFPDAFHGDTPGFDAIVGNPPFLGGWRITGVNGTAYREWLVTHLSEGRRGSADLVAYFFLRSWTLLRDGGTFGLLAVNTIAEGDTRQVGLEAMIGAGATVHAAYPNQPWPGKAAVVTSRVHVYKGTWGGDRTLLGQRVPFISAFLSAREDWTPKRLQTNRRLTFEGSKVTGMGFVLNPVDARRLLDADSKNSEVIFPYLSGDDLNSDPKQQPSRWVINFWDWSEERARTYKQPWAWIEERVRPERQRRDKNGNFVLRKPLPERWWQFGEKRPGLYHALGRGHSFEQHPEGWNQKSEPLTEVLVSAKIGKYFVPSVVPNEAIFMHMCAVFASPNANAYAAFFNSSLVQAWIWRQSSRLEMRLVFSPSDAVETLPLLSTADLAKLDSLGSDYLKERRKVMADSGFGLTKLYNRFHDSGELDPGIALMREIHREIDAAVARAYGWDDLELGHDFHEVPIHEEKDRVRFTVAESARLEILRRFSELNRQRYEEEVARELHTDLTPRASSRGPRASRSANAIPAQTSLDFGAVPANEGQYLNPAKHRADYRAGPVHTIVEHLKARPGWHAKADILAATGITDGQWNTAIGDLIENGRVERQGERRGARYRLIE